MHFWTLPRGGAITAGGSAVALDNHAGFSNQISSVPVAVVTVDHMWAGPLR